MSTLFKQMEPGVLTARFAQRTTSISRFAVDSLAGRYIVLCFFGSAASPQGRMAIDAMWKNRLLFDDNNFSYFGVSVDPQDEKQNRLQDAMPGVRFMLDFDASVSRECGARPNGDDSINSGLYRQFGDRLADQLKAAKTHARIVGVEADGLTGGNQD